MVETWRDSWFEEGSRLIYIVAASAVDAILPLQVDPAPLQTVRVFVGRIELVTPETRRSVASAIARSDWPAIDRYSRFLDPILRRIYSALSLIHIYPTTVLSFLAVLATLGLGKHRPLWQTSFLVAGIFCGSMAWWTILASGVNLLRGRITDRTMRWMNRVAGVAIGAFGLVNVLLSRGHRH